RFDPRCFRRGLAGRFYRHPRPLLSAGPAARSAGADRGLHSGAGFVVHAHLSGDGRGADLQAGRSVFGGTEVMPPLTFRNVVVAVLLIALALLPVYSQLSDDRFTLTLFTRIIILALSALSLNLILGFGGMMSFGHAVYLGIGGYAV